MRKSIGFGQRSIEAVIVVPVFVLRIVWNLVVNVVWAIVRLMQKAKAVKRAAKTDVNCILASDSDANRGTCGLKLRKKLSVDRRMEVDRVLYLENVKLERRTERLGGGCSVIF